MTEYVILKHDDSEPNTWRRAGIATASSPKRALSVAEVDGGTYVAVPVRSWHPLTVKTEQVTKVTIG